MSSAASPPSPRLCATRSRSTLRHVPGFASLASFAGSTSHDSCNAAQSGAGRCNPEDAATTQPMTQTQGARGRNDASGRDGRLAPRRPVQEDDGPFPRLAPFRPRRPTFARVAFLRAWAAKSLAPSRRHRRGRPSTARRPPAFRQPPTRPTESDTARRPRPLRQETGAAGVDVHSSHRSCSSVLRLPYYHNNNKKRRNRGVSPRGQPPHWSAR